MTVLCFPCCAPLCYSSHALLSQALLGCGCYSKDGVCTAGDVCHTLWTCVQAVLRGAVNCYCQINLLCCAPAGLHLP